MADLIIIPVCPSAFDVARAGASAKMVQAAGKVPHFVLVACRSNRQEQNNQLVESLAEIGNVIPVRIGLRVDFEDAIATGQSVTEFQPRGKAAAEIKQLWRWIKEQLWQKPT